MYASGVCCFGIVVSLCFFFFFSSRRRHTRFKCDWSSDVCSSDLCTNVTRRPRPIEGGCVPGGRSLYAPCWQLRGGSLSHRASCVVHAPRRISRCPVLPG